MANEILKDEIMTEEELDGVSGGTIAEAVKDTQFLHDVGLMNRSYDAKYCKGHMSEVNNAILDATAGLLGNHTNILVNASAASANRYVIVSEGEEDRVLTREQFYKCVGSCLGRTDIDYSKYL